VINLRLLRHEAHAAPPRSPDSESRLDRSIVMTPPRLSRTG
jgi:hypothetical protein